MTSFSTAAALAGKLAASSPVVVQAQDVLRRAKLTGWLPTFVVAMLGWQTALFLALVEGAAGLVAYVGLQVACCVVPAAWLVLRLRRPDGDERHATALQIVAWSAVAGPFGAIAAAGLAISDEARASGALREADADNPLEEPSGIDRVERVHTALLDRRVRLSGAHRIRPLMDVIAEGSRSERLDALRVVYRNHDSALSAVLRRALHDPDASVRVLAATIMAKLHGTHGRAIGDRQSEAASFPNLERNWLTLAEARLAYARSGLLEPSRARAQVEVAIGDLERAVEIEPCGRGGPMLAEARRLLAAGAE